MMSTARSALLPRVGAAGAGLLACALCVPSFALDVIVGVISPDDGRDIGKAHDDTVRFAFETAESTIEADGVAIVIKPEYRHDDGEKPETAVAAARELDDLGAVAILGPIDSGNTAAVLAAGLDVPVLSALSSATALTGPKRDRWFFRMTMSDSARMAQYANVLRKRALLGTSPLILYDDASPYGTGLEVDLNAALKMPDATSIPWSLMDASKIVAMDPPPTGVFVLGTSAGSIQRANQIETAYQTRGVMPGSMRYFFVGFDGSLRKNPLPRSLTIGEPTIVDLTGDIKDLRESFAKSRKHDVDEFLVTAYESVGVVRQALQTVLEKDPAGFKALTKKDLREALRAALDDDKASFDSLEAWRSMRFVKGDVYRAPPLPIYEASSGFGLLAVDDRQPYLEVTAPARAGYLQGPVSFKVRAKRADEVPPLKVLRTRSGLPGVVVDSTAVKNDEGDTEIKFYPSLLGRYQLTGGLPTKPGSPAVKVVIGPAYLLALLGALLGSALYAATASAGAQRAPTRRIVLGVVTGLAIAILDFHRDYVPGGNMLPKLGSTEALRAFWDGLAGGWVGPGLLILIAGRLFGAGFEAPKSASPSSKPAAPSEPAPSEPASSEPASSEPASPSAAAPGPSAPT